MSRENVEIVRGYLDRVMESPDEAWKVFDADVEWDLGALRTPDFPAVSHGPDSIREFFRRWIGAFEDWGYDVEEIVDGADAVAAHVHQRGRGKGSGVVVDNRFWQVWYLRDGKAVRVLHFATRDEALEAAGAPE